MPLVKKTFAMSMYLNKADLYEAKADHYENQAEKLQMELVVAMEKTAHLERVAVLSRKLEAADRLLDMRDRDMS